MEPQKQITLEDLLKELLRQVIREEIDKTMERHLPALTAQQQATPHIRYEGETAQEFMDTKKAADYLSLARSTLYILIYKKAIPYFKSTRKVYFRKADLDAYIMKKRVEKASERD